MIKKCIEHTDFIKFPVPDFKELITPQEAMTLAWREAKKGLGWVQKNPLVGCVLVDNEHRFIAKAAHLMYGEDHAEAALLEELAVEDNLDQLDDATLYVTLEPCAHEGKTPSCAKLLASLPLKKVVFAAYDKNLLVNGMGEKILKEAGISTELCPCEWLKVGSEEALEEDLEEELLTIFETCVRKNRPHLALKVASTLNGVVGKKDQSLWLTNETSRAYSHWLRQKYDGIVIGAGTLILDDPGLDIRILDDFFILKNPAKIIYDPSARAYRAFMDGGKKFKLLEDCSTPVYWFLRQSDASLTTKQDTKDGKDGELEKFVHFISLDETEEKNDLNFMVHYLFEKENLASLLFEGGPTLWDKALKSLPIDELYLFLAPKILSGDDLLFWKSEQDITIVSAQSLGDDLLIKGKFGEKSWN